LHRRSALRPHWTHGETERDVSRQLATIQRSLRDK
jgi:hypothetical protein